MRLLIEQIKVNLDATDNDIFDIAKVRISNTRTFSLPEKMYIYKRSVDARHKDDIKLVCTVCAEASSKKSNLDIDYLAKKGIKILSSDELSIKEKAAPTVPPLVVGFGPAGMFCALILARAGYKPTVIDRGSDMDTRVSDVKRFYATGILNTESNIQFGAGGAGTFSDGKLTTRINDPKCAFVLKTLCQHGAPDDIMYKAKPHIGTDRLRDVVKSIEEEIISLGGRVIYRARLDSFDNGIAHTTIGDIPYTDIVLAIGHSARDTYKYLMERGFAIEPKAFSVGVRVEHLQTEINEAMYGKFASDPRLGSADYNISHRKDGKGVYSFCMCPGGEVVAATSEEGGVVVNGMSVYARDGKNANSAICVQVDKTDYGNDPRLAIEFQRGLERKAFAAGGSDYTAPVQTLGDFYEGVAHREPDRIMPSYMDGKVKVCDMNGILPKFVCDYLKLGFREFGKKIKGFDSSDVPITGVETRTSAPLRILRDELHYNAFMHANAYPCGEGAGYAGGIMSASVDGINVALAILNK
ncbi:MAG: hypothetical protein IJW19_06030 [Clostridia bacterium]|nr:hypothetical protein [Clostridia bacterium]